MRRGKGGEGKEGRDEEGSGWKDKNKEDANP